MTANLSESLKSGSIQLRFGAKPANVTCEQEQFNSSALLFKAPALFMMNYLLVEKCLAGKNSIPFANILNMDFSVASSTRLLVFTRELFVTDVQKSHEGPEVV